MIEVSILDLLLGFLVYLMLNNFSIMVMLMLLDIIMSLAGSF